MLTRRHNRRATAFTLIELLVVIAIIALLTGILLPAIGKARSTARGIVCLATMRDMNLAQQMYMGSNRDYYSSPVNVGARYIGATVVPGQGIVTGGTALEGNRESSTPTSSMDWITPLLADSVTLSTNRARKTAQIFNDYGCAEAREYNTAPYRNANPRPTDFDDFDEVIQGLGILQGSYLMPSGFAHLGKYDPTALTYLNSLADDVPGGTVGLPTFRTNSMLSHPNSPRQPTGFRHKLDRVGTSLSNKAIFADGTRYWSGNSGAQAFGLTVDPSTTPEWYGAFTEPTPTYKDSVAWGQNYRGDDDVNLALSFRHGGKFNVAYFDGSVRSMASSEAWTNPNPWHPTGTLWVDGDNTQESIEFMLEQKGNRPEAKIY